jgi:threonine/homoserine/homoserine lactone efflux protein
MNLLRLFITGMLISFLGALPLGTLNVAAMQISVSDGFRPALYFALGALLMEVFYVRVSLVAMNWVRRQRKLFLALEWLTLLIIVALAVSSFYAALHPAVQKNPILSNTLHRFWLGTAMSAFNPVQIPFWFGWSTVLISRKVLLPRNDHYNLYMIGIGIGSFVGFCVFIFGGQFLVDTLHTNQHIIQWVIGFVFAITALIQCWRILRNRDPVSKLG